MNAPTRAFSSYQHASYKAGTRVEWKAVNDEPLSPYIGGRKVAWAPLPGSQELFLTCPVDEVLYEGTRGPGKTESLLVDFAQHVGQGFGSDWRGVLFRKTYPDLQDVIEKSQRLYKKIWPAAEYNQQKSYWTWPTGERLSFRPFAKESDYWDYHGHAYPWIGWEELTSWPTLACYLSMFSCSRSTRPGMPRKIRATTNPYGVGHNVVKKRFRLPIQSGKIVGPIIRDSRDKLGNIEPARVAIHGQLSENLVLMHADPNYAQRISASAKNPQMAKAWLKGSWDIVAGGMFDDVWRPEIHEIPPFKVPHTWRIDRSFDWGSSKPFSVGWWAESDGSDVEIGGRWRSTVAGDLFRIGEWYGWKEGEPNVGLEMTDRAIAEGIVERELAAGIHARVVPGPAGSDIFIETNNESTERTMRQPVRLNGKVYPGVRWTRADNRAGSRVQGWKAFRERLENSIPKEVGRPREFPGLFIVNTCQDGFIRTIPTLVRDDKNIDDVETNQEDHCGDEARYRITHIRHGAVVGRTTGER